MMPRQQFLTSAYARLRVQRDAIAANGELENMILNTGGALGGYGYLTDAGEVAGQTNGLIAFTARLNALGQTQAGIVTTHDVYVTAGQYVAAYYVHNISGGPHKAVIAFYDSAGAVVGSSTSTAYLQASSATAQTLAATVVPAGAVSARVYWRLYENTSGDNPANGRVLRVGSVRLAVASTSAALSGIATADYYWTDVITSTTEITARREALNVGTLTARIVSNALAPTVSTTLRPGRRVVLEALVGATWEPLFTGRTGRPRVTYDVRPDRSRVAVTTMTAYDAVQALAATPDPEVFTAVVTQLAGKLEEAATPVPWSLNGDTGQVQVTSIVNAGGPDPNAKLLDTVVRVRDSVSGAAWASRAGVVTVVDADHLPTTVLDTITHDDYNVDLDVGYDTDSVINTIMVRNWVGTPAVEYGPYRNRVSARKWGEGSATYTTTGLGTGAAPSPQAFAVAILTSNANPVVAIDSATVPMDTAATVARFAVRDLWDRVTVTCADPAVTQDSRIAVIEHRLTCDPSRGDRWFTTHRYAVNGRAPSPTT